jgi:hypothetical protein
LDVFSSTLIFYLAAKEEYLCDLRVPAHADLMLEDHRLNYVRLGIVLYLDFLKRALRAKKI